MTENIAALITWLGANRFKPESNPAWYRRGNVRVVITDPEGYATVYVFDPANPRAQLLLWEADFSHAPAAVMTAAVQRALDERRAAMLPGA